MIPDVPRAPWVAARGTAVAICRGDGDRGNTELMLGAPQSENGTLRGRTNFESCLNYIETNFLSKQALPFCYISFLNVLALWSKIC